MEITESEVRKSISLIKPNNELFEFRFVCENKATYSGYFTDVNLFIDKLKKFRPICQGNAYITLNKVNEACYSRSQRDNICQYVKSTTSDNDIISYEWLYIDLDPKRTSGTSSTNEQLQNAELKAINISNYLRDIGFKEPIIANSGNGYHLLYKINLDVKDKKIIKDFIKAINLLFKNDDNIEIDSSVDNPSRICKLYGTKAQKGADTEERPHRMSKIVYVPENGIEENSKQQLEKVISDVLPKNYEKKPTTKTNSNKFDLGEWIDKHGIRITHTENYSDTGTKYILEECPFDSNHTGKDACLIQYNNGAIVFHCFHNSCSDKKWQDVRKLYEPNAYDKGDYKQGNKQKTTVNADAYKDVNVFDTFKSWTLETLTEEDKKPPEFFIDEFLPIGLTFIIGGAKVGKSYICMQMIFSIIQGEQFFGFQTHKTGVVYFDVEEVASSCYQRINQLGYGDVKSDDYKIINNLDNGENLADGSLLNMIAEIAKDGKYRVFIIDTYSRCLGATKTQGNAYHEDVELLKPIQNFAMQNKIAIVFIHHEAKGKGNSPDTFDRINGTGGISGTADTIINIARKDRDRTAPEATVDVAGRLCNALSFKICIDKYNFSRWVRIDEIRNYISNDAFCKYVLDNRPAEQAASKFISYNEIYKSVFQDKEPTTKDTNNVKSSLKAHLDDFYIKENIAISFGCRSGSFRGIQMLNIR